MGTNWRMNNNFAIACGVKIEKGKPAVSGFGPGKPWLVASGVCSVCTAYLSRGVCAISNWLNDLENDSRNVILVHTCKPRVTLNQQRSCDADWTVFIHTSPRLASNASHSRSLPPSEIMHFLYVRLSHHVIGATVSTYAVDSSCPHCIIQSRKPLQLWRYLNDCDNLLLWLLFSFSWTVDKIMQFGLAHDSNDTVMSEQYNCSTTSMSNDDHRTSDVRTLSKQFTQC